MYVAGAPSSAPGERIMKKLALKRLPVDPAKARHLGLDRHALDVEGERPAHTDAEILGGFVLHRHARPGRRLAQVSTTARRR